MKKIIFALTICSILAPASLLWAKEAKGIGNQGPVVQSQVENDEDQDKNIENDEDQDENTNGQEQEEVKTQEQTQNKGESKQLKIENEIQQAVESVQELQEKAQERAQELQQEVLEIKNKGQQKVLEKQNDVRLAVHNLLAMENLTGGIGKQVSAIAKDFNNSVQKTVEAEEKIESRGFLKRIFFGGDSEAAQALQDEIAQNKEKIQQLLDLDQQARLKEEIKQTLQEQIQILQQEQDRLQERADKELASKGIFGWLFGWLKK